MKKIIVLFLIIFSSFFNLSKCFAEVGTIQNKAFMKPEEVREYMKYMDEPEDVQRAREALFNDGSKIEYKIDINKYKDFFVDKKYSPNQKFRNGTFLSDGKYVLFYPKNPFFIYYEGFLVYLVHIYYINEYPAKEFYYDKNGKLKYATYEYIGTDGFVFDSSKNFLCKCRKHKCYGKNGELVLISRPYIPFN